MNKKITFEEAVLEISRYHYGEREDFPFDELKAFGIATTSKICTMCKRRKECPIRNENILECNFYIKEDK